MAAPRSSSADLHLVTSAAGGPVRPRMMHAIGGRPDVVRAASIFAALEKDGVFDQVVVHSGDPQDAPVACELSAEPGMPAPDHWLGVGAGRHAPRTAAMLGAFEAAIGEIEPEVVVVYGAGDTALACGLAAAKLGVALVHVEAGLRFPSSTRDAVNRVLTDQLADTLLTPTDEAAANLLAEGVPDTRVHAVGDTAIDVLRRQEPRARARAAWTGRGGVEGEYVLVALHRRSNLLVPGRFAAVAASVAELANVLPVLVCVHPRALPVLHNTEAVAALRAAGVDVGQTRGYLEHLSLLTGAGAVVTDAGGIQDETSALGVACFTLAAATDRAVTLTHGTNVLMGDDPAAIADIRPYRAVALANAVPLWDGRAGERAALTLTAHYALR